MLVLVLGDSLPLLFIGWEGVGLCSYLLIGFWYREIANADAGRKAMIANRDRRRRLPGRHVPALLEPAGSRRAVARLRATSTAWRRSSARVRRAGHTRSACSCFVGATGKSAQIPLYVWLPDAMAGPTPVSALIHAATMVTAGVYMIARLSPLYVHLAERARGGGGGRRRSPRSSPRPSPWCRTTSRRSSPTRPSRSSATCSSASASAPSRRAIFHLMTHAFFKALLFLCAGSVMHAMHGELDVCKMGGLRRIMPVTAATFLVGALAIAGVFPLRGLLLEGHDPRAGLRAADTRWLWAARRGRRRADRLLHLPRLLPRLRRARAASIREKAQHAARVAGRDDHPADRPRGAVDRRRLDRAAARLALGRRASVDTWRRRWRLPDGRRTTDDHDRNARASS